MKQIALGVLLGLLASLSVAVSAQILPAPIVESHTQMPVRGDVETEYALVLVTHGILAPSRNHPGFFTYTQTYSVTPEDPGSYVAYRSLKEYPSKREALESWIDYQLARDEDSR